MAKSESIPDHHRPLSHILAKSKGEAYRPLRNLEEAKATSGSYLIMEGDWGGQIYLSCPVNLVNCSEKGLNALLHELDSAAWKSNEGEGAGIYFECLSPGDAIPGGMGGGIASEGLWIHPILNSMG